MSIENVKKLELAIKKLGFYSENLSDKENQKIIDEGGALLDEVSATNDIDVLCRTFDFFTEENENGICETLQSEIYQYYDIEQIINVFCKKFFQLVANNEMRAVQFAGACLKTGNFEKFRKIFDNTKFPHAKSFLNRFNKWYAEYYPEEIAILRADMEKW
jgi:hypothetical protein